MLGFHTFFCFVSLFPAKSTSECPNKEPSGRQQGAALEPRSGNAQNRGAGAGGRKKTCAESKSNKRKQVESDNSEESQNQPPEKKRPKSASVKTASKTQNKKKLIAGQGKLTSFFRVWTGFWLLLLHSSLSTAFSSLFDKLITFCVAHVKKCKHFLR